MCVVCVVVGVLCVVLFGCVRVRVRVHVRACACVGWVLYLKIYF